MGVRLDEATSSYYELALRERAVACCNGDELGSRGHGCRCGQLADDRADWSNPVRSGAAREYNRSRLPGGAERDQVRAGRLTADQRKAIDYWSRGAEALYGYSADEARGRVARELLRTTFPEPLADIERALRERDRWEGELVHVRKDGMRVDVHARWVLNRDAGGRPAAIMQTHTDITARRRAEATNALLAAIDRHIARSTHVDDVEGRRALVDCFDAAITVLVTQPEQRIARPQRTTSYYFDSHAVRHDPARPHTRLLIWPPHPIPGRSARAGSLSSVSK